MKLINSLRTTGKTSHWEVITSMKYTYFCHHYVLYFQVDLQEALKLTSLSLYMPIKLTAKHYHNSNHINHKRKAMLTWNSWLNCWKMRKMHGPNAVRVSNKTETYSTWLGPKPNPGMGWEATWPGFTFVSTEVPWKTHLHRFPAGLHCRDFMSHMACGLQLIWIASLPAFRLAFSSRNSIKNFWHIFFFVQLYTLWRFAGLTFKELQFMSLTTLSFELINDSPKQSKYIFLL